MNFSQDTSDLRNRYRQQSSRTFAHTPMRNQPTIQSRPHAIKRRSTTGGIQSCNSVMKPKGYKLPSHPIGPKTVEKQVQPVQSAKSVQMHIDKELPTIWRPTESKRSKRTHFTLLKNLKTRKPQTILVAALGFVLIFGLTMGFVGWNADPHVEAQAIQAKAETQPKVDASVDNVIVDESEVTPEALASHTVPTDHPKRIMITKAKVEARVFGMGLKNGNQLDPPKNIFDMSWYDKSAKPGSGGGAVLLNGYAQGSHKNGVLYNLKTLAQGDQIAIERGDGQVITYEVVQTQSYPKNDIDMTAIMLPIENGKEGLNIVTSHGEFGGAEEQEHFVVFAVRIS